MNDQHHIELVKISRRLDSVEADVAILKADMSEVKAKVSTLDNKVSAMDDRLTFISGQMDVIIKLLKNGSEPD